MKDVLDHSKRKKKNPNRHKETTADTKRGTIDHWKNRANHSRHKKTK